MIDFLLRLGMKKNKRLRLENIYVGDSEVEGRGVFAGEDICAGTLIEEAHYQTFKRVRVRHDIQSFKK